MKLFKTHLVVIQTLLLLGVTSYFSCGVKAQQAAVETVSTEAPKLLFINYSISKDANGKYAVTFINKIITDGRLKDRSNTKVLSGEGDIVCIQFDKNKGALERTYIKNPLKPVVEYVNDDGELEKRELNLDSAQFPIKLQLNERTSSIQLVQINASGQAITELITTSIQ